jgi:hypothetical protein
VARRKLLRRTHALVCVCERFPGKSDLHDEALLAAQTARIQEHSTATGDLGVGPRIAVAGGIDQVPRKRVKRSESAPANLSRVVPSPVRSLSRRLV